MQSVAGKFGVPEDRFFTDFDACMAAGPYDMAILCAATADHADYVERLAPHGVHVFVEKPFAASTADARRMIAAMEGTGKQMAINWPLRWVESHVTAKRLIDEGLIGDAARGAFLRRQPRPALPPRRQGGGQPRGGRAPEARQLVVQEGSGGGSLLDYMGYGATLGTWYMNGARRWR
jgi:predicted dehydrogenase